MSDTPNNPVTTKPQRNISTTARLGVLAAMAAMAGGLQGKLGGQHQGRRYGKHNGRNPGAFGKQK